MTHTFRSKFFPGALAGFLLLGHVRDAFGITNNISDISISNVIVTVANHWQHTVADGSYPAATVLSTAQNATKPTGITNEYAWGVNLYGQLRVKDATGNTNAENFALNHNLIIARYYAWLVSLTNTLISTSGLMSFQDNNAVLGTFFTLGKLDYCGAITAQMLEGALRHASGPTIEQVQMAMVTANYVSSGQARTNGTLYRPERGATIWADDLYMSCPFLIRWYQYTGNTNFLDDAANQVISMAGYLQDTDGLWFHGYYCTNHYVNGVKWGRGNGWAMVTTAEVLSVMPTNHPARTNLLTILRRHIAGVEAVQASDGMWHQVLDHPEVWEETSCTALYAYSIARAVNRGWIDPTNMAVARKAFAAIAQLQVSASGVVSNICPGTSLSNSITYYTTKLQPSTDDRHGPGPVMLAGAEILLTPKLGIVKNGNQAVISWNGGLSNFNLHATTNLIDWNIWTNLPAITNWQSIVTDSNVHHRFFRLSSPSPGYPPTPLNFEAESLARVTNGATATVSALDTNASGGYFVTLNGDGAGDYIEFTLTNVPAGAYHLKLVFPSGSNRGQLGLKLDGNPLGGTLDEYWATTIYPLWDFGPVTFASTGDHTVRLTVAGKNVASSSYTIAADKFMLVPQ
ncbi:MAG: glycoside hydrolase family 88 protein [Verrucomicrobiota bacterium]|jgi:rhamnogalacturonyl hydrolase YesR